MALPLFGIVALWIGLAAWAWRQRAIHLKPYQMISLFLALSVWAFAAAMETMARDPPARFLWGRLQWIGPVFAPGHAERRAMGMPSPSSHVIRYFIKGQGEDPE